MKVEIRFIRESSDTPESLIKALEKLGDSYCPILSLLITREDIAGNKTISWEGTLDQLNQVVEIRESHGKNPDSSKMLNEFREVFGLDPLDFDLVSSRKEPMKV